MKRDLVEALGTLFGFCSDRTAVWRSLTKQGEPRGGEGTPAAQMPQVRCSHPLPSPSGLAPCLSSPVLRLLVSTVLNVRLHGGEEKGELS